MEDEMKDIEKEADKLTVNSYLGQAIYGGIASKVKGIVTNIKYFDYAGTKERYLEKLKKGKENE